MFVDLSTEEILFYLFNSFKSKRIRVFLIVLLNSTNTWQPCIHGNISILILCKPTIPNMSNSRTQPSSNSGRLLPFFTAHKLFAKQFTTPGEV